MLQLGRRRNLDTRRSMTADAAIDPVAWRQLRLVLIKGDGGDTHITLLRPEGWLESLPTDGAGGVFLNLPELDVAGYARVVAVEPCPAIASGPGVCASLKSSTLINSRQASGPQKSSEIHHRSRLPRTRNLHPAPWKCETPRARRTQRSDSPSELCALRALGVFTPHVLAFEVSPAGIASLV